MRHQAVVLGGILASLVLLCGCEESDPFPADHCTLASVGDMPVLTNRHSPLIPVMLNGKKVAMEVDTGAAFSVVSESIADQLALPRTMSNALIGGVDGSAFASIAQIDTLGVGNGQIHNISLVISPAPMTGSYDGLPMAGLFGGDFLYNYDVLFDLPHRQFSFYREFHCPRAKDLDLGWNNGFYVLDFEQGGAGARNDKTKISVKIKLDGHTLAADLDSGAYRTMISLDDAHDLGVTDAELAADPKLTLTGMVGNHRRAWLHHFASIEIGPERFTDVPLMVGDSDAPTLLGADFIRTRQMLISYWRSKIFIERRPSPQPPSPVPDPSAATAGVPR